MKVAYDHRSACPLVLSEESTAIVTYVQPNIWYENFLQKKRVADSAKLVMSRKKTSVYETLDFVLKDMDHGVDGEGVRRLLDLFYDPLSSEEFPTYWMFTLDSTSTISRVFGYDEMGHPNAILIDELPPVPPSRPRMRRSTPPRYASASPKPFGGSVGVDESMVAMGDFLASNWTRKAAVLDIPLKTIRFLFRNSKRSPQRSRNLNPSQNRNRNRRKN